jgi:nucleoid DNA-binding protein
MLSTLYKYLVLNEIAAIPGVGTFSVTSKPATITAGMIHPPMQHLSFQAGTALTDKKFYSFLATETGVTEVDAVRKFQDFAYQLRKDLQTNSHIELTGLGVFNKKATGELSFESSLSLDPFFPSIPLTEIAAPSSPVIENEREVEEHGIEVYPEEESVPKDRWWIWPLVLALIALTAIAYYYLQEGVI